MRAHEIGSRGKLLALLVLGFLVAAQGWETHGSVFSTEEQQMVQRINLLAASASIAASSFILFCIVYLGKTERIHSKMVLGLVSADMVYSFTMIGNPKTGQALFADSSSMCFVQGFVMQFAGAASSAWVLAIASMLYSNILSDDTRTPPRFRAYFTLVNSYALCTAFLPSLTGSYGDAGPFCWIGDSKTGQVLRYLCFYVPTWLFMITIGVLFYWIIRELNKLIAAAESYTQAEPLVLVVRRLSAYPIVMSVCFIAPTMNRIQNTADPDNPSVALYVLYVFFANLNGLANSVVFGLTDEISSSIKAQWCGGEHQTIEEDNVLSPRSQSPLVEDTGEGKQRGSPGLSSAGGFVEIAMMERSVSVGSQEPEDEEEATQGDTTEERSLIS